jgi:ribose-phosphate pyrophosphokinase
VKLALLAGGAHPALGRDIAEQLGIEPTRRTIERFPDSELHVAIEESVRGHDVNVVQPTCAPVNEHLFELVLLGDACARAGAARITAVIPYFGYARQDRRASGREAIAARVAAEMLGTGHFGRVVAVDLHTPTLEGFFPMPIEHLSAMPLLAAALQTGSLADGVVVSPDLGAVKLAQRMGSLLGLPVAVVHKSRQGPQRVVAQWVVGDVRSRAPIVVDDMLSTGATVAAAVGALLDAGARPEITVAAAHGLFVGPVFERLRELPLRRCVVSDSVPSRSEPKAEPGFRIDVVSLAPLLADAIRRLHAEQSLAEISAHA